MNCIECEKKTISAMINMYCRAFHSSKASPCFECKEVKDYAYFRLDRCIYAANKPTCNKCKVQCWEVAYKDRIINIMRFSGPRLIFTHPILAFMHIVDSIKSKK